MVQLNIREVLEALALPILEERGAFLIDSAVKRMSGRELVQLFVDTERGITIDECAALSKILSSRLDEAVTGAHSYTLEVSSPGADQPLKILRQYPKHIGRLLKVRLAGSEGITDLQGVLESIEGQMLYLKVEPDRRVSVPFESIIRAVVVLPW